MNPQAFAGGLVSVLHRTSITGKEIALASTYDTSESYDSGLHDNQPVFIQNLPGKEHFAIARSFTLRAFLQQPDKAQAGVCELSLSAERLFCRWLYHLTQSALAHVYYSIHRLVVQVRANSSSWLEATGFLGAKV